MSGYGRWRRELFAHFSQNHDLHLLETEMDDIECLISRHMDYLAQMNGSPAGAVQMHPETTSSPPLGCAKPTHHDDQQDKG